MNTLKKILIFPFQVIIFPLRVIRKLLIWVKPNSIKFEISILITLLVGFILILFSSVLYIILSRTINAEFDNELKLKANSLVQNIRAYAEVRGSEPEQLKYAFEKSIKQSHMRITRWWMTGFDRQWAQKLDKIEMEDLFINMLSVKGASLFRSHNMMPELVKVFIDENIDLLDLQEGESVFRNIDYFDKRIRVVNVPFIFAEEGDKYILQVASPLTSVTVLLENWLYSIFISIPIILLLTFFVGRALASRILNPVEKITKLARTISNEDLTSRVESKDYYLEMNNLIEAFNDMISRLEKSFKHIEDFSSHVSHELRTPVTIIKGEAELALLKDRTPKEYKRVLSVSLEEVDRMLKIIEDLLLLTKLDYHYDNLSFEEIDFSAFIVEVYDQSRILAAKKKLKLKLQISPKSMVMNADKLHLRRLFFNLIDNAIKFTPEGGNIDMIVGRNKTDINVSISDTGGGIARKDLNMIFDRFYHTSNQELGTGLGLSIAQTIAKIHKGKISVKSIPGKGSTFTVILPRL